MKNKIVVYVATTKMGQPTPQRIHEQNQTLESTYYEARVSSHDNFISNLLGHEIGMHLQRNFNGFIIGLNLFSLCLFCLHMEWLAYLSSNVCAMGMQQCWNCFYENHWFQFSNNIKKPNWFFTKIILHKRELTKVIDFVQLSLSLLIPWGGGLLC